MVEQAAHARRTLAPVALKLGRSREGARSECCRSVWRASDKAEAAASGLGQESA